MLIRRERRSDRAAVARVHTSAFPTEAEARLADALRDGGYALDALSLVATSDRSDDATRAGKGVIGHVVCSRGDVGGRPALGLGPIGVLGEHQGEGVGTALMHAVVAAADALDEPCIALLGDPGFYERFGFVASAQHGIAPPVDEWGDHFQVRTLTAWDDSMVGRFSYARPFDDL